MVNQAHALGRDELVGVLTAYSGVTTNDGDAAGTWLIDTGLMGLNDFITGKTVLIMSGVARHEIRAAIAFNPGTGRVTMDHALNGGQVFAGTYYRIINLTIAGLITQAGKTQVMQVHVTAAANAGDVVLATVTAQDCLIKKVNVRSNGATTANLTNIGVYAGAGKVVTLIDNVTGVRANIAAADQQVGNSPLGSVVLAATKTVVMTLTGTGAAAVDLTVTLEYEACVDGGSLV